MKKSLTLYLVAILIGGTIGFISAAFSFTLTMPAKLTSLPLYTTIIIVIFTHLLAVTVHEIGHAYIFSKNGIKMRAVIITFFLFIKMDGNWKMKFRPNNITALGGIAIPDVASVKSKTELERMQKAYSKALIAGPIASIILLGVVLLISVTITLSTTNDVLSSAFFTLAISITVITSLFIGSSFIKNEVVIGDFPAYKLAKNDLFFVSMLLYQYAIFSTEHERIRNENDYVRHLLVKDLEIKLTEQNTHIYTLGLIDQFIIEYLSGRLIDIPQVIFDYVDLLTNNKTEISKLKRTETGLSIYFHLLLFMHTNEISKVNARGLYLELKEEIKPKTMMRKYLIKQADHIFGIEKNSNYLQNINNICTSPAHGIWKNFEGYYVDEIILNEKITT